MERENKGKSIISFPSDYVIIDIETTGLSPLWDKIIEVSALKCHDGTIISVFSSLINIHSPLDEFISALTGITDNMLRDAPELNTVLSEFISFIGNSVLVGHNVSFDINFLYDSILENKNEYLSNDYIDTMRISRKLHPDQSHHRLIDLCNTYKVDNTGAHRSLNDCIMTQKIYELMKEEILSNYDSFDSFASLFIRKRKHPQYHLTAKDISCTVDSIDTESPVYGKVFVFTGALEQMLRKDAMQIVVNLGGINGDNVTSKTNYLVLGNNDYCSSIKDGKSTKQKKAEKLKLSGQDIEIIPENVFYDMINM